MNLHNNVLVIAPGGEQFERIAPPLLRRVFEVDRIPTGATATELLSVVPFKAVIVRIPVPDMSPRELVAAIHSPESATRGAPVALVADDTGMAEARALLGRGATVVMSVDDPIDERDDILCGMLGVQPRRSLRTLVKLDVQLADGHDRFIAQIENLSATGMLVATPKRHPIGSVAGFEFLLHDQPRPFRGSAEVVRHATRQGDGREGMGYRFLSFEGDRQHDLERLLVARAAR